MKMKILTAAVIAAMLTLTACGEADKASTTSEKPAETTTESAEYEEVTTETFTDPAVVEDVPVETIPETNESVVDPPLADFSTPTELSTTYADLDNRSFKYNGKLMTVGVSTLQDFIDAGAEFEENTTWSQSGLDFDVLVDKEFKGQFNDDCVIYHLDPASCGHYVDAIFINPDNSPRKLRDCVLAGLTVFISESIKPESGNNFTDKLEFAFDSTLTHDSLVANSGEPTIDKYSVTDYTTESKTIPDCESGYSFGFSGNGKLVCFDIYWIP
ncbi:hypothetical protein [Ruminococcus albus]|uniref:Lipoprotein n=1 Tax=Ruminococcus albus TaxID=1264 RepID=A0A1H7PDV2_RUMAL|nr:hypothetical protein [Ruminococcus albus]SEL33933.1 hypothetical protein SAMN05216469_1215 [Ruminococcus albus]